MASRSTNNSLMTESVHENATRGADEEECAGDTNNTDIRFGPQVGMSYSSIDTLQDAYERHGISKGFNVILYSCSKRKKDEVVYKVYSSDKARKNNTGRKSKRVECPARLTCSKKEGRWHVLSRVEEHNHGLVPELVRMMPSQRNLTIAAKRQLEAYDIAGIRTCKSIRLMEVQSRGPEFLGALSKDCRNFVEQRRRLRLGDGDAEAISKLFLSLQKKDSEFFHLIETDDKGRMRDVLWIHPRSKAAFEDFNDVVCFDTTYLVNKYKMPFATFVGINHHGQSILLGCAPVSNEDVRSFKWLFNTWKEAMGREPRAILTDQCDSIRNAIEEVFPNTVHRFCLWHIMYKVPEKFKNLPDYDNVKKEFNAIVYDTMSVEDFERRWNEFVANRSLQSNQWLTTLYCQRYKWAPIYLRHMFWAGMVSNDDREIKLAEMVIGCRNNLEKLLLLFKTMENSFECFRAEISHVRAAVQDMGKAIRN